ncbi:MAG TPA: hypothetical protein VMH80_06150 [Bryobacteraceae bacterium]|nr:hypothetical protein [Bryobacteraceae bacterium]
MKKRKSRERRARRGEKHSKEPRLSSVEIAAGKKSGFDVALRRGGRRP